MKLIDSEMFRVANQSKERRSQGASMWMWRGRVSHCFGALCQPVLDLGGGGESTLPRSDLGENAGTWAWMLNMGGLGFQAQGHGVSVNAQEYSWVTFGKWGRRMEGWREEVRKKKRRKGVGGVSGREKTVKPWENGGWDLFHQDNRDWPMKMHPSQGH